MSETPQADAIWQAIARAVEAGKSPRIEVSPSAALGESQTVTRGVRKYGVEARGQGQWILYKRSVIMLTPSGQPMMCRRRGCMRYLGNRIDIVCSDSCRKVVHDEAKATLAVLEGRMDPRDYPDVYRSELARRRWEYSVPEERLPPRKLTRWRLGLHTREGRVREEKKRRASLTE